MDFFVIPHLLLSTGSSGTLERGAELASQVTLRKIIGQVVFIVQPFIERLSYNSRAREDRSSVTVPGSTPAVGPGMSSDFGFDDEAVAAVIESAAQELASRARSQRIAVLIAWPIRVSEIHVHSSGWCELGRLSDPAGRFWWLILWHPERAQGRLLRYFAKAPRGSLGEILQPD